MLEAAVEAGVHRFVHGSTIGVYGISNNRPVRDDSPLQPDNIYGITKLEGEKVVRQFFDKLPIAIVRISETYGPGDRRLPGCRFKDGDVPGGCWRFRTLADPHDATDIAQKIVAVINDENVRQTLRKKGLKRAATFTWDKTARLTLDALVGVVNNHRKPRG